MPYSKLPGLEGKTNKILFCSKIINQGHIINLILLLHRSPVHICENFHCVRQCAKQFMYLVSFHHHNNSVYT